MTSLPLAIYCDDPAHLRQGENKPRVVKVETILWRPPMSEDGVVSGGYFLPDRHGRLAYIDEGVGAPPPRRDSAKQQPASEQSHDKDRRWRFHCRLCKRTVTVRDDRLSNIGRALFVAGDAFDEQTNTYRVSLAFMQRAAMLD